MIKLNTAKQAKRVMIATGVLSAIFLVGCNSSSQPSGKPLSKLTSADAYKIRSSMLSKADEFNGYNAYPKCVSNYDAFTQDKDNPMAKMAYSGDYKASCETIFKDVTNALVKEGYAATEKDIKNLQFASKLAAEVTYYKPNKKSS